jgi:Syntaxin-5 N-terminal, Sly1p-binding domain
LSPEFPPRHQVQSPPSADQEVRPFSLHFRHLQRLSEGIRSLRFASRSSLPRRVFCFLISTLSMVSTPIQDRTSEFRAILTQAQKRQNSSKVGSQRVSLLSDAQKREANGSAAPAGSERRARSEFARNAAQVGRGITASMGKLERLAQCISHPVTLSNTD